MCRNPASGRHRQSALSLTLAICIREAKKEGHDTFSVVLRLLALGSTMSAEPV
jgi:hypothetical protein